MVEKTVGRGALSPCLRLHWPLRFHSPLATNHSPLPLHLPVTRRIKVVRTTEWGNPRHTNQLAALGFTAHRPPATLPSRSAIARPRLCPRLPLELWLRFRPSAPAVSDLSSCDSRPCFDSKLALFGAFSVARHLSCVGSLHSGSPSPQPPGATCRSPLPPDSLATGHWPLRLHSPLATSSSLGA